jgi:hypothetical protein
MNDYQFLTTWRVEGTTGEVADVLRDPLDLARWWPAVYLEVEELEPPDERGLHQRVRLRTKGWLPYTLQWEMVVTESRYPDRFALQATGDFVGTGLWTLEQDGAVVNATYDWRIRADKPLLQRLGPVMRPLLEANHRWAMSQGEESLKLELLRRRASSVAALRSVPPPPGPITYAAVGLLAGTAALAGGVGYLLLRWRRRAKRRADVTLRLEDY